MKTFTCLAAAVTILFASCNNLENYFQTAGKKELNNNAGAAEAVLIPRDTSLSPEIAYNDIFLDSLAVENYIKAEALPPDAALEIRNFYNARNYQFAWLYSGGFTEGGRDFWNLYTSDSTNTENNKKRKTLFAAIDTLITRDSFAVSPADTSALATELFLTQQFVPYARAVLADVRITRLLPVRKMTALQWADTILDEPVAKNSSDTAQAPYYKLKKALHQYRDIAKQGSWPVIPLTTRIQNGIDTPQIAIFKKRLAVMGDYPPNDTTAAYNDTLDMAVRNLQQQYGMKADGIINDSLIALLNIPAEQRIQQLIINMNRMLWMPQQTGNYIEVNIPEFMLHVYEGDSAALSMPVVVGKEGTGTVLFTGRLNQVVFSPYWNIPASIVRDELLPAMKQDPAYLKRRNMEIVGKTGSLPVIRQLPGGDNALGKVKFLFPNRYDIYFHDTPAKDLFSQEKRAFSHGCIRLADAERFASYVLRHDAAWTPETIRNAMNTGKEQYVKMKTPLPVVISYYTAWMDQQGHLHSREDVYGHDQKSARLLFLNTVAV